jgi:uncharacterized metal-binding protein YceD (DUF177 family)
MKLIKFEHIPDVGLTIEHDFSADLLSELLDEPTRDLCYKATEPAHVVFKLERKNKDVLLTGGGFFKLSHPCVRCLEPVEIRHELIFDLELEQPQEIDLKACMREELFLELPGYPACESPCLI